ncbi:MAG: MBL fold metallo-hydrolase [Candidatus Nezhaarchaeales archaeon]
MPLQKVFEIDRVKIKVYGGLNEIGGNCIVIEEGNRKVVFDNGVRFSLLRRFYGGKIEPLGPTELRSLGIVPPVDVFQEAQALYISHLHLDHTGLLSLIPPTLRVKVPSVRVLSNTLATWYKAHKSWLAYVPPDYMEEIGEVKPKGEDENRVIAIPVSHSCFPSYSFLYLGEEKTIFYSGDLRFESLAGVCRQLNEVLEEVGIERVDVAILEGTNFSGEQALVTPSVFRESISLVLKEYELISISTDPLDLETFVTVSDLSLMLGRDIVIGSERLLWILDEVGEVRPQLLDRTYVSDELETPVPILLKSVSLKNDVLRNPGNYTLLVDPMGLLRTLRKLKMWEDEVNLVGSVVVLMDPEPRESIREVEEEVLRTWLKAFGMQTVRLRLSGHYLPHQFRDIIETLKPRELIPIHTEDAETMKRLFRKFCAKSIK